MASSEYSTWKRRPSGEKVLRVSLVAVEWERMCVGGLLDPAIWEGGISRIPESVDVLKDVPYSDREMNILGNVGGEGLMGSEEGN